MIRSIEFQILNREMLRSQGSAKPDLKRLSVSRPQTPSTKASFSSGVVERTSVSDRERLLHTVHIFIDATIARNGQKWKAFLRTLRIMRRMRKKTFFA